MSNRISCFFSNEKKNYKVCCVIRARPMGGERWGDDVIVEEKTWAGMMKMLNEEEMIQRTPIYCTVDSRISPVFLLLFLGKQHFFL